MVLYLVLCPECKWSSQTSMYAQFPFVLGCYLSFFEIDADFCQLLFKSPASGSPQNMSLKCHGPVQSCSIAGSLFLHRRLLYDFTFDSWLRGRTTIILYSIFKPFMKELLGGIKAQQSSHEKAVLTAFKEHILTLTLSSLVQGVGAPLSLAHAAPVQLYWQSPVVELMVVNWKMLTYRQTLHLYMLYPAIRIADIILGLIFQQRS